jgi:ribosomal protein S18 acetylase RimI-like enzyme
VKLLSSISQVQEALSHGKVLGTKSATNLFVSQENLEKYASQNKLWGVWDTGACLLLRRDRDFFHLYGIYSNVDRFEHLLNDLDNEETYVADLLGRNNSQLIQEASFRRCGFEIHRELKRIARLPSELDLPPHTQKIEVLSQQYSVQVLDHLEKFFDRFSEQIPELEDIEQAMCQGQIIGTFRDGYLAAFLYYEADTKISNLRFWFVHPDFRDEKIGGYLIRKYLHNLGSSKVSHLWVVRDNVNAIKRYEHYGYVDESLTDRVLIRRNK